MERLTRSALETLTDHTADACASFFVPDAGPGEEPRQASIRLKNQIRQAERLLAERGVAEERIAAALEPVGRLAAAGLSPGGDLALFAAPGFLRAFRLPKRRGRPLASRVDVGGRFAIRPLLPALEGEAEFYVLALSQRDVRLIAADEQGVRRIDLRHVPRSLEQALGTEVTRRASQIHPTGPAPGGAAIVQSGDEQGKDELSRYFQRIDAGLREEDLDRKRPVVLAGVGYLLPLFRQTSTLPNLIADSIVGNPDGLSDADLAARAAALVEPGLARQRRREEERFAEFAGTGRTSTRIEDILPAARQGRIEALFVVDDAALPGRFDAERDAVLTDSTGAAAPTDDDLLELAARLTLGAHGQVFAGDRAPGDGPLAALFRY